MGVDMRLVTGASIGIVLGLHYHSALVGYLPILLVVAGIFVLKTVRR